MIKKLISNIFNINEDQVAIYNKICYISTPDKEQAKMIAEVAKTVYQFVESPFQFSHYMIRFPIKRIFE